MADARTVWGPAVTVLVALGSGACSAPESAVPPVVSFDTAAASLIDGPDTTRIRVEVADTEDRRARGLMGRESLDDGWGMVFIFSEDQSGDSGFWMWRTLIPLDIAFLDEGGYILAILPMEPCLSQFNAQACPIHAPGVPYRLALEVNRGWFTRHDVAEGARLVVEGAIPES